MMTRSGQIAYRDPLHCVACILREDKATCAYGSFPKHGNILELYRDSGKENGKYHIVIGYLWVYWEMVVSPKRGTPI